MRLSIKVLAPAFITSLALIVTQDSPAEFRYKLSYNINSIDTTGWNWPDSLDAVRAAPNSHRVLFENDKIRILEVTIGPYGFEPMHTHRYPSVMFGSDDDTVHYDIIYYRYGYDAPRHIYFVKDSMLQRAGGGSAAHYMGPEGPHRIKNLSDARIVAYRVEFKEEKQALR